MKIKARKWDLSDLQHLQVPERKAGWCLRVHYSLNLWVGLTLCFLGSDDWLPQDQSCTEREHCSCGMSKCWACSWVQWSNSDSSIRSFWFCSGSLICLIHPWLCQHSCVARHYTWIIQELPATRKLHVAPVSWFKALKKSWTLKLCFVGFGEKDYFIKKFSSKFAQINILNML